MTSQVGVRVSPPTWGALRDRSDAERPAADRRADGVHRPAQRALAALELRGPSAFPSEAIAGAVLLALWVLLWAVSPRAWSGQAAALRDGDVSARASGPQQAPASGLQVPGEAPPRRVARRL